MKRLEETHGPVFELTRHFLAHMFDSELFAGRDRWRPVAIAAFMLLLHTAVLLPKAARYQRLSRLPAPLLANELADEAGQITLFLAIAGLVAMLRWQMLLPSRRDYMALASLPIRPRQIFLARFVGFLVFAAGVVAALNAPLGPMAPSRGAASALACIFALFSMVALQGALTNLLPAKLHARVSAYAQGALAAAFFLAALESWHIGDSPEQAGGVDDLYPRNASCALDTGGDGRQLDLPHDGKPGPDAVDVRGGEVCDGLCHPADLRSAGAGRRDDAGVGRGGADDGAPGAGIADYLRTAF
ncbi:MAG: hypothetical protein ABSG03_35660 [Bryobacteraceae bacterium]